MTLGQWPLVTDGRFAGWRVQAVLRQRLRLSTGWNIGNNRKPKTI